MLHLYMWWLDSDRKWCETPKSVRWKQMWSLIFRSLNYWQVSRWKQSQSDKTRMRERVAVKMKWKEVDGTAKSCVEAEAEWEHEVKPVAVVPPGGTVTASPRHKQLPLFPTPYNNHSTERRPLEMKVACFPSLVPLEVTRGWVRQLTSCKIVIDPLGSVYPQASSGASAGSKAPWQHTEVTFLTAAFCSVNLLTH